MNALLTLNIGGQTFYFLQGETWQQAIQNHPTENAAWSVSGGVVITGGDYTVWSGNDAVSASSEINASGSYYLNF